MKSKIKIMKMNNDNKTNMSKFLKSKLAAKIKT